MKTRRATTITLEIPQNPIPEILSMIQDFASESKNAGSDFASKIKGFFASNRNNKNKFKTILPIAILGIVVVVGLLFVGRFIVTAFTGQTLGANDSRVTIRPPKAVMPIDKTFEFPLKDDKGKEISKLKFFVDDAELRDEIIINGQKFSPPQGTTYLIVTLKLTNDSNSFVEMKVRNYIRLTVNGQTEELLAAGIHNDPVEVQPQSTKLTRLGFPVKDTDKDLVLRIGDLEGKKELVALKFN